MIAALISAAVAFSILAISQWIIFRRERSRLLLGKLEDLYYLLLDLGERNVRRFEPLMLLAAGHLVKASDLSFDKTMAADLLEKVDLLVNFYFPQLKPELEAIFEANRECMAILQYESRGLKPYKDIVSASTGFADRFGAMQR